MHSISSLHNKSLNIYTHFVPMVLWGAAFWGLGFRCEFFFGRYYRYHVSLFSRYILRVLTPVLDRKHRVLLILGGFPPGAIDWKDNVANTAATRMEEAAAEIYTEPKWRRKLTTDATSVPRRGSHASKHVGPSMGGAQEFPQNLAHSTINAAIFARLFGQKCFQRIAGWTNGAFPAIV
jgi:hypothetical protein